MAKRKKDPCDVEKANLKLPGTADSKVLAPQLFFGQQKVPQLDAKAEQGASKLPTQGRLHSIQVRHRHSCSQSEPGGPLQPGS